MSWLFCKSHLRHISKRRIICGRKLHAHWLASITSRQPMSMQFIVATSMFYSFNEPIQPITEQRFNKRLIRSEVVMWQLQSHDHFTSEQFFQPRLQLLLITSGHFECVVSVRVFTAAGNHVTRSSSPISTDSDRLVFWVPPHVRWVESPVRSLICGTNATKVDMFQQRWTHRSARACTPEPIRMWVAVWAGGRRTRTAAVAGMSSNVAEN